jgi:hypothetical protein
MAGSCGLGNEILGSLKGEELFDQMRDLNLLKKVYTPFSWLFSYYYFKYNKTVHVFLDFSRNLNILLKSLSRIDQVGKECVGYFVALQALFLSGSTLIYNKTSPTL